MSVNISVVCFKSKTLSNGEHPLFVKVSEGKKRATKSLGLSIRAQFWNFEKNEPKKICPNREALIKMIESKKQQYLEQVIDFKSEDKNFTPQSLVDKMENSSNTIGIRFRELRALYNKAIEDNLVHEKNYPFKRFKVARFSKKTSKRAIKKEDIKRIMNVDLRLITKYHSPLLYLSKDLFLFSYLGCGINLIDIAYLRYENIIENRLRFNRHKTGQPINFALQGQLREIILKYAKEGCSPKDFIFPILDRRIHKTQQQQDDRIIKVTKGINKNLKKIGQFLNLSIPITTYVARHSFATVLKRSGVNISIISEALGHTNLSTTQYYLDSFDNEQIDAAMQNLL
ncbi:site-specific integrase [Bacteroides sp. MSB163]|uniref:site-specific integrase n=1 Tax=Bacteroides maternus TaxID=3117552 RepID=UPI002ED78BCC